MPCKFLTAEQVQSYERDGFLVVKGILSTEECDRAYAMYRKYAKGDFRGIMNLYRGVVEYENVEEVGGVEQILVDQKDQALEVGIIRHPKVVAALEDLQQAEVVCLQTMLLFKKAGSPYAEQAWNPHQDNAYPKAARGKYITANLSFVGQDQGNGCMYIYPGSHHEPLLPCEMVKSFHEGPGKNPGHKVEVPGCYEKKDLIMPRGSVLFLHGHVIHGSYGNGSQDRDRPMLLIPYITKGAEFIPGQVAKRTPFPVREGQVL